MRLYVLFIYPPQSIIIIDTLVACATGKMVPGQSFRWAAKTGADCKLTMLTMTKPKLGRELLSASSTKKVGERVPDD